MGDTRESSLQLPDDFFPLIRSISDAFGFSFLTLCRLLEEASILSRGIPIWDVERENLFSACLCFGGRRSRDLAPFGRSLLC